MFFWDTYCTVAETISCNSFSKYNCCFHQRSFQSDVKGECSVVKSVVIAVWMESWRILRLILLHTAAFVSVCFKQSVSYDLLFLTSMCWGMVPFPTVLNRAYLVFLSQKFSWHKCYLRDYIKLHYHRYFDCRYLLQTICTYLSLQKREFHASSCPHPHQ